MKEIEFRNMVNGLWGGFSQSDRIVKTLEGIGLFIDIDKEGLGLRMLYGIQDTMANTIQKVLSIKDDSVLEAIDCLLINTCDNNPESELFPEDAYQELLKIIKDHGFSLPWEKEYEKVVRHRALSTKDNMLVDGYIWNGADHAYIIPSDVGIGYDEKTNTLTAYAVEVKKDTLHPVQHQIID